MRSQKECAPTVQSQGANGTKPPRIIARFCESWGITPRTLFVDIALAPLIIAGLYALLMGMFAIDAVMHQ